MSKRRHCEVDTDIEKEITEIIPVNEEVELENHEEDQIESGLLDNSNSGLSTLDEKDKKGSIVWDHFDKFVVEISFKVYIFLK